jgi:membrane protein implicated in regulation of membrane protease activity
VEIFYYLNHWHWWGMGALWLVAELLAPCTYFLAIGLASAVTGIIVRLVPGLDGLMQVGIFLVLLVIALLLAHRRVRGLQQARINSHDEK